MSPERGEAQAKQALALTGAVQWEDRRRVAETVASFGKARSPKYALKNAYCFFLSKRRYKLASPKTLKTTTKAGIIHPPKINILP